MRFSLRTILFIILLLSIALAFIAIGNRRRSLQLKWLTAAEAKKIFPPQTTREANQADGMFQFTFRPRHTSVQNVVRNRMLGGSYSLSYERDAITMKCNDEAFADQALRYFEKNDVNTQSAFVICGLVQDRNGKAVADAAVDLLGTYQFINHFQTRDDGTFTMVLRDGSSTPPPGNGYYLQVRGPQNSIDVRERWTSSYFELDPNQLERDCLIRLPWSE